MNPAANPAASPVVDRTRWGALVALGAAIVLAALDMTIVAVALPAISTELAAPPAVTQWVMLAYFLPMVALAIPVGRWLDRAQIRAVFGFAVTGFGATSLLVAVAPNLPALRPPGPGRGCSRLRSGCSGSRWSPPPSGPSTGRGRWAWC